MNTKNKRPKTLSEYRQRPLTLQELAFRNSCQNKVPPMEPTFLSRLIFDRLKVANCKVSIPLLLFATSLATTPGEAILWAWQIFNLPSKTDTVTLEDFIEVFGNSVPDYSSYEKAWDDQKDSAAQHSNLLDETSIWVRNS